MELNLPYIDPFGFAKALVENYGFNMYETWNALNVAMPDNFGTGSLLLFIRKDIHYFRGKWKFNEQTILRSNDEVGKRGLIDFRIDADGEIHSTLLEGKNKFEHDTTRVNGMRIFIPEKYLPADKSKLISKFDQYRLDVNIAKLLSELFNIEYAQASNSIFLEGKMLEFIYLWIEYLKKADISKHFSDISGYKLSCIKTAKAIIEEDSAAPISLSQLSLKAGINDCDLKRNFRKMYGLSIHQYIIKTRMEKARELIVQTDLPIREICSKIGYINRGHFAQLYQRLYGVTPLSDRKAVTDKNPATILSAYP